MSKIVAETTASILAVFSGQTVTHDDVCEQIEQVYTSKRRRAAYSSYAAIYNNLLASGVVSKWTGPNYTGTHNYTFPALAI